MRDELWERRDEIGERREERGEMREERGERREERGTVAILAQGYVGSNPTPILPEGTRHEEFYSSQLGSIYNPLPDSIFSSA